MKYGINLYLWADDMHDGLMPVLEKLKKIGYDGVEVPIFDLDLAKWKTWAKRLDELGLERTANTVIAPEHNPVSADPKIREAAFQHMEGVVESCATKMFLANPGMDRDAYREIFHLNETEAALIAGLVPKQQILIKRPDFSKVVNLNVDPSGYWLYTSNPYDNQRRKEAFERYGFARVLEQLARSNS